MHIFKVEKGYSQLEIVARWLHDQWGHHRPDRTIEGVLDHLDSVLSGDLVPSLYVAEIDQVIVGTASLVECDLPLRPQFTPWLASVFVAPGHRNRGIASQLVRHIEKMVAGNNIKRLFLFTPDAQALYEALGWHLLESLEYRGETVDVMDRYLPSESESE